MDIFMSTTPCLFFFDFKSVSCDTIYDNNIYSNTWFNNKQSGLPAIIKSIRVYLIDDFLFPSLPFLPTLGKPQYHAHNNPLSPLLSFEETYPAQPI